MVTLKCENADTKTAQWVVILREIILILVGGVQVQYSQNNVLATQSYIYVF